MQVECGFWGLAGALIYAGSKLILAVFGGEPLSPRQQRRAWAQFVLAAFSGPVAAGGFSPTITHWLHGKADMTAVALAIGLSANVIWPVLVEGLGKRARIWAGDPP